MLRWLRDAVWAAIFVPLGAALYLVAMAAIAGAIYGISLLIRAVAG